MRDYLLARLREPSTWRGIILLLSAFGVAIRPDLGEAIIALGVALSGGVAVLVPDRLPERVQRRTQPTGVRSSDPATVDLPTDYPRRTGREDLERWES